MKYIGEIFKREVRCMYTSRVVYVVLVIFSAVFGYLYFRDLSYYSQLSYRIMQHPYYAQQTDLVSGVFTPLFNSNSILFLLIIPPISRRLVGKKSGARELMFINPAKDIHIVLGIWLAKLTLLVIILALSVPGPIMAFKFAGSWEWGSILAGYLGMFLMGVSFMSLCILISVLSGNRIVGLIISYGVLLGFWLIGWTIKPNSNWTIADALSEFGIIQHLDYFIKGMIDTKDVLYYVLFIFTCVILTVKVLEFKRWGGWSC